MIGLEDGYKVVVATTPLYFALMLGYGSVRWWKIFGADQCDAINRLVCYFTFPLFTLQFTAQMNPFAMNYRFIGADFISKAIIFIALGLWAKLYSKGSYDWSITGYSLCTLTNALVVGVPVVQAMYGQEAVALVVQSAVIQAIVWLTLLLFVLEFRQAGICSTKVVDVGSELDLEAADTAKDVDGNTETATATKDVDGNTETATTTVVDNKCSIWTSVKMVSLKLVVNPNIYSCVLGLVWAFVANRWHFQMPSIMEGSIQIMSNAGTGTAMFNMGIFMALQKRVVSCGTKLAIYGMILKFIAGPAAMAIGCVAMGLHGDALRVSIIQAAIPQSITAFVFAKEYGLHADVLSTAVIFGMMVSLPVLVGFYAVLEFVH